MGKASRVRRRAALGSVDEVLISDLMAAGLAEPERDRAHGPWIVYLAYDIGDDDERAFALAASREADGTIAYEVGPADMRTRAVGPYCGNCGVARGPRSQASHCAGAEPNWSRGHRAKLELTKLPREAQRQAEIVARRVREVF